MYVVLGGDGASATHPHPPKFFLLRRFIWFYWAYQCRASTYVHIVEGVWRRRRDGASAKDSERERESEVHIRANRQGRALFDIDVLFIRERAFDSYVV